MDHICMSITLRLLIGVELALESSEVLYCVLVLMVVVVDESEMLPTFAERVRLAVSIGLRVLGHQPSDKPTRADAVPTSAYLSSSSSSFRVTKMDLR